MLALRRVGEHQKSSVLDIKPAISSDHAILVDSMGAPQLIPSAVAINQRFEVNSLSTRPQVSVILGPTCTVARDFVNIELANNFTAIVGLICSSSLGIARNGQGLHAAVDGVNERTPIGFPANIASKIDPVSARVGMVRETERTEPAGRTCTNQSTICVKFERPHDCLLTRRAVAAAKPGHLEH